MSGHPTDPYIAFRFEVSIDGIVAGGFEEVGGIELTTTVMQYAEGGRNGFIHNLPGPITQSNITLKRGVVDRSLWNWYAALLQGDVQHKSGTVTVFDPTAETVQMRIDFLNAIPAKWTGPGLSASQSQIAVETLELAHQGLNWQS